MLGLNAVVSILQRPKPIAKPFQCQAGTCSPKPDIASHGALWMEEGGPFTGKDKVQVLDSGHMIYCCLDLSLFSFLVFCSYLYLYIYRYIFKVLKKVFKVINALLYI